MKRDRRWLGTLIVLGLLSGCQGDTAFRSPDLDLAGLGPVAVIPFEPLGGDPNAGLILSGLIEQELQRDGRLRLVPREEVAAQLAPAVGEVKSPAELAQLCGAEALIVGQVSEYRYKRGIGEEPLISLSVRLLDPASGRVLWSDRAEAIGRYSWAREDSLGRLAAALSRDLAQSLLRGPR